MFLSENLKITLSASIAFDRSNAPRGSPKIRRILGVREYGLSPLLQAERENKSVYSRNDLSFSVGLKVIFFADAKSDIFKYYFFLFLITKKYTQNTIAPTATMQATIIAAIAPPPRPPSASTQAVSRNPQLVQVRVFSPFSFLVGAFVSVQSPKV